MKDIQLLIKKDNLLGKYTNIYPKTYTDAIIDKLSGKSLHDILLSFNMYFLNYTGNTATTRLKVPTIVRKRGLWITYVKYDNNVYTEWYAGELTDDTSWLDSANWRVGNNSLVGDITISSNGNWVINGTETDFKAIGEKGNTPLLRIADNKLLVSYNLGLNYMNVTENPVYTRFRWLATVGDTLANNVGRILVSTDEGKTWTNMSNDFTNNLHISRYIGINESLPTSGIAEGTIYAKGPTYDESDTSNSNPIYRLWVYAWKGNTLAWQDNGEFTSIAAGVVQEVGYNETDVMSQKATTLKLNNLENKINSSNLLVYTQWTEDKLLNTTTGNLDDFIGYSTTDYLLIKPNTKYGKIAIGSWYDKNKNYIVSIQDENKGIHQSPSNAAYLRISIDTILIPHWYICEEGVMYAGIEQKINEVYPTNLIAHKELIEGKYVNPSDGNEIEDSTWVCTDFIKILPNTSYGNIVFATWYGANKNYISGVLDPNFGIHTSPKNAYYARFSIEKKYVSSWTITVGGIEDNSILNLYHTQIRNLSNKVSKITDIVDYTNNRKIIHVGDNYDFQNFSTAIIEAKKYNNPIVIVHNGIYDLIEENPQKAASGLHLVLIDKSMTIYFAPNAKLKALFAHDYQYIRECSPIFLYGDASIDIYNMNIECSNSLYCVHDETYGKGTYEHRFFNCIMKYKLEAESGTTQCIGGGLGRFTSIIIDGGYYESIVGKENPSVISYHNGVEGTDNENHIEIRNVYIAGDGSMTFGNCGQSTIISDVLVSNCCVGSNIKVVNERNHYYHDNIRLLEWNNVIRM